VVQCVVYLDRQHSGKPGKRAKDTGAGADIDGDGTIELHEQEALLTPRYIWAAELALRAAGHIVIPISDGSYTDRFRRINSYVGTFPRHMPQVMIACHLNAGRGSYGSCFYDYRSRSGPELAARIAKQLRMVAPELNGVKCIAAKPDDWTRNAFATIQCTPVAICFEPFFIDADHAVELSTPESMTAIGRSLAAGIDAWAQTMEGK
jgi:hypothetical protein